jgi:hypothetical protein
MSATERPEVSTMTELGTTFARSDHELRGALMITPHALAALERQARREEMTLGELVGCVLENAAKRVLIEESVRSIELGSLCDDDLLIEHGFDIGGGDA